jgi:hypothetical protein
MYVSVWKCIKYTVYLLHVSATHVAIFRDVLYKEYIHRNITYEIFFLMHLYKDDHMSDWNM